MLDRVTHVLQRLTTTFHPANEIAHRFKVFRNIRTSVEIH